jgi:hypothetical protein
LLFCCDGISASLRTGKRTALRKHLASLTPSGSDVCFFLRAQPTALCAAAIKLCSKKVLKGIGFHHFYEILLLTLITTNYFTIFSLKNFNYITAHAYRKGLEEFGNPEEVGMSVVESLCQATSSKDLTVCIISGSSSNVNNISGN